MRTCFDEPHYVSICRESQPAVCRTKKIEPWREQAKDYGVSGYLVKPIDEKSLIPNIELVVAQSKEMKRLRKDMAKVSERLANRSIIEKAKGQVMQEQNLSEQEAYHYIRKLSQLKGLSMRRVAEMILVKGGG